MSDRPTRSNTGRIEVSGTMGPKCLHYGPNLKGGLALILEAYENESCYRYVDCLTVHSHRPIQREATMASELSGRRCDVKKWHDTNHRKDILGSVFHR
jgi:hypothetical protein